MQAAEGITVDGIVGPVTWRTAQRRAVPVGSAAGESTPSLNQVNDVRGLPLLHRGDRGDSVVVLQKYLDVLLTDRKIGRDGIFGPRTEEALRTFQARQGLTVDGYAGPKTYQALYEQPGARR